MLPENNINRGEEMKKLLGILIIFSSLSMHAAEETYMGIIKEDITRPFKQRYDNFIAKVDHFKRCMGGSGKNCTKREALAVARAVGVAALLLVAAAYKAR